MKSNLKMIQFVFRAILLCVLLPVIGCNRAAVRIPGASLSFPETQTNYIAGKTYPNRVVVLLPVDLRQEHYGEKVAGTNWAACRTNPLSSEESIVIVRDRLATAISDSKIFSDVSKETPGSNDLIVHTEIQAFCSQVVGFIYGRVAGICSMRIVVERNGKKIMDHKFERVVTDADPEYTGKSVGFIEQAMKVTMADSLRELLKDFLGRLDMEAKNLAA